MLRPHTIIRAPITPNDSHHQEWDSFNYCSSPQPMLTSKSIATQTNAVEMRGITKHFPGVLANEGVDFEVRAGEIHALLGENGAGKTTLMNILCGLYEPDAGEIRLFDQPVKFHSPREAIAAGIGMVHQHFMLVERFTVADNIILGQTQRGILRENPKRLHRRLQQLADQYGLKLDPATEVWQLSVGEQQRVEILKALYRNARILILDEPTAVLTPQEVQELLPTLRSLAEQGTAIIFITHKLNEVLAVCHRVTVLRDGRTIDTLAVEDCSEQQLAQMMVGREVNLQRRRVGEQGGKGAREEGHLNDEASPLHSFTPPPPNSSPALAIKNLWVKSDRNLLALRGIDLEVYPGEIVGIAGVDGNGQRELEEAIAGLRSIQQGELRLAGQLAHIPSDRYSMGLLTDFSVAENLVLKEISQPPFNVKGLLRPKQILKHAVDQVQRFLIRTPSVKTRVGKLSGGNAQKIVFARELSRPHQVILAAQPTRGLDVGATEYVHCQLLARRDAGAAILLISTELDEILSLSDRIAVLYEGKIVGWVNAANADVHHLGLLMAGRVASQIDNS
jgi:general nucleoside transport system ATP-binding protein